MKKILFHLPLSLLSLLVFITSCLKDAKEIKSEDQTTAARSDNSGGCRMTMYDYYDAKSGFNAIDYFSYKNGLVDEWASSYGWVFKMEYSPNGRMKAANVYESNVQITRVEFVWQNGKVIKELWYQGNTDIVDDEWVNTYNHRGNLVKNESVITGLKTLYTYEENGQIASWHFFVGDIQIQKGEYTSNQQYKNPFKSASGIEYAFPYVNGGLFSSQAWYSSEKITLYDENGDPFALYDLDPAQTVWHPAMQNYPQQVDYTDILSGGNVYNTFAYENCTSGENTKAAPFKQNTLKNRTNSGESIRLMHKAPGKEIKSRITALRNKIKR